MAAAVVPPAATSNCPVKSSDVGVVRAELERLLGHFNVLRDPSVGGLMLGDSTIPVRALLNHPQLQKLHASTDLLLEAAESSSILRANVESETITPQLQGKRTTLIFRELQLDNDDGKELRDLILNFPPEYRDSSTTPSIDEGRWVPLHDGDGTSNSSSGKSGRVMAASGEARGWTDAAAGTATSSGGFASTVEGSVEGGAHSGGTTGGTTDEDSQSQTTATCDEVEGQCDKPAAAGVCMTADDIIEMHHDNGCWFVTLGSEDLTQRVALWLRSQEFHGRPIRVGVKSSTAVRSLNSAASYPLPPFFAPHFPYTIPPSRSPFPSGGQRGAAYPCGVAWPPAARHQPAYDPSYAAHSVPSGIRTVLCHPVDFYLPRPEFFVQPDASHTSYVPHRQRHVGPPVQASFARPARAKHHRKVAVSDSQLTSASDGCPSCPPSSCCCKSLPSVTPPSPPEPLKPHSHRPSRTLQFSVGELSSQDTSSSVRLQGTSATHSTDPSITVPPAVDTLTTPHPHVLNGCRPSSDSAPPLPCDSTADFVPPHHVAYSPWSTPGFKGCPMCYPTCHHPPTNRPLPRDGTPDEFTSNLCLPGVVHLNTEETTKMIGGYVDDSTVTSTGGHRQLAHTLGMFPPTLQLYDSRSPPNCYPYASPVLPLHSANHHCPPAAAHMFPDGRIADETTLRMTVGGENRPRREQRGNHQKRGDGMRGGRGGRSMKAPGSGYVASVEGPNARNWRRAGPLSSRGGRGAHVENDARPSKSYLRDGTPNADSPPAHEGDRGGRRGGPRRGGRGAGRTNNHGRQAAVANAATSSAAVAASTTPVGRMDSPVDFPPLSEAVAAPTRGNSRMKDMPPSNNPTSVMSVSSYQLLDDERDIHRTCRSDERSEHSVPGGVASPARERYDSEEKASLRSGGRRFRGRQQRELTLHDMWPEATPAATAGKSALDHPKGRQNGQKFGGRSTAANRKDYAAPNSFGTGAVADGGNAQQQPSQTERTATAAVRIPQKNRRQRHNKRNIAAVGGVLLKTVVADVDFKAVDAASPTGTATMCP